jgi:hypothetical protein
MQKNTKKTAAPLFLSHMGNSIGKGMLAGLGAAASTGLIAGVTLGAQKAYQAMTKERDFKQMMNPALNPDLHELQSRNPVLFNQAYSSLRDMHSDFAKDPLVAGTLMRQIMDNPASGGGVLVNTVAPMRNQFPAWARDKMVDHGGQTAQKIIHDDFGRLGRIEDTIEAEQRMAVNDKAKFKYQLKKQKQDRLDIEEQLLHNKDLHRWEDEIGQRDREERAWAADIARKNYNPNDPKTHVSPYNKFRRPPRPR